MCRDDNPLTCVMYCRRSSPPLLRKTSSTAICRRQKTRGSLQMSQDVTAKTIADQLCLTALGKNMSKYTLTTLSSVPISGPIPSKPISCSTGSMLQHAKLYRYENMNLILLIASVGMPGSCRKGVEDMGCSPDDWKISNALRAF